LFIEHALAELEYLRFMLKENFKLYNGIYFHMVTLKFTIKYRCPNKSVTLATLSGTMFSLTVKPMHTISQNFASNIHVLEHILSH